MFVFFLFTTRNSPFDETPFSCAFNQGKRKNLKIFPILFSICFFSVSAAFFFSSAASVFVSLRQCSRLVRFHSSQLENKLWMIWIEFRSKLIIKFHSLCSASFHLLWFFFSQFFFLAFRIFHLRLFLKVFAILTRWNGNRVKCNEWKYFRNEATTWF